MSWELLTCPFTFKDKTPSLNSVSTLLYNPSLLTIMSESGATLTSATTLVPSVVILTESVFPNTF
jgi:hypothetical protein